jgi:hypothetical protein
VVVEEETRVDTVVAHPLSPRDVHERHVFERVAGERGEGVDALVERVRVQVAKVEHQVAARGAHDLGVEAPLVHRVVGPAHRPRDVLQQEGNVGQVPARPLDVARDHGHRFARARELREVPDLPPPGAREGHVLGHHGRTQRSGELTQALRAALINALGAAERELHPVRDHRPDLGRRERLATRARLHHAALGHHLDEVELRATREELHRDLGSPADADALKWGARCHDRRGHGDYHNRPS